MRKKIYKIFHYLVTKHYNMVVWMGIAITIFMIISASTLRMNNKISDMMPNNLPVIKSFNKLVKDFNSDCIVMVAVERDSSVNDSKFEEAVEKIAKNFKNVTYQKPDEKQELSIFQRIKIALGEYPVEGVIYDSTNMVKRVDYTNDLDFFKHHGMIIQKTKDLENSSSMYSDLSFGGLLSNINKNLEKEFVGDSENLKSLDGEEKAIAGLENCMSFIHCLKVADDKTDYDRVTDKFLFGDKYFYSSDRNMILLSIVPSVPSDDYDLLMKMASLIRDKSRGILDDYEGIKTYFAGTPFLVLEENESIINDFGILTIAALGLVFLILAGSFRSIRNPFNSIIALIVSIIWVSGILALTIKFITIMSASFGIILVGLGIDFAIHIISGVKEGLQKNLSIEDSVKLMYEKVGNGVITGGLTTAAVFFSLNVTGFKALTEMGITMGMGMIVTLFVMFLLLPALMVRNVKSKSSVYSILSLIGLRSLVDRLILFVEKFTDIFINSFLIKSIVNIMDFKFMNSIAKYSESKRFSYFVILTTLVISIFAIFSLDNLKFEYNMMEMEPAGMPSVIAQDKIIDKFELSPDFAMFTVSDEEKCREEVDQLKKMGNRTGIIGKIDAITEFYGDISVQKDNIPILEKYKSELESDNISNYEIDFIISELERLHFNIVEIGELSVLSKGENNKLLKKCDHITGKSDRESKILAINDLISKGVIDDKTIKAFEDGYREILKKKLITMSNIELITADSLPENIITRYQNKKSGNYLITVYPNSNIWEERNLKKFAEKTSEINPEITGMPIITLKFIDLVKEKGNLATLAGFLSILILILIDFRSFKYTALALIPLAFGALWMVGSMSYLDIKINYNNVMVLPIILGIGIDDGVHVLHRYFSEGKTSISKVIKSTGKAVLLTSITTMIGFGSLAITAHRGMASMGYVLTIGVLMCFFTSIFVLPAILNILKKRG
ncbi:MAG: MMPL family transporter [Candidatus Delongbacteria bacterium]|nr:MMPL family transporter [Candidatus Delongbacteria bacterium]MBN2833492.1 MMPL family transporter [Candidatus Delongbacteria bacterium]